MDDINRLKGRMSEALVEGIFKRAQYMVARVARETQVSALIRTGLRVPAFVAWKALDEPSLGHRSYRLLAIEVRYCPRLEDDLRREAPARSPEVALQWPELYEILVTDRPEPGRSCFQAVHVSVLPPGTAPGPLDLHQAPGLDIYRRTVEEYEGLVREVFPLLGSRSGGGGDSARPLGARGVGLGETQGHRPRKAAGDHGSRPSAAHEQRQGVSE
ncbi:MAG TPA: hypothetical protein VLK28_12045 [Methylomirabilota bacterium]|nr:hypothetical protein [Methylomirabilota bacterium]